MKLVEKEPVGRYVFVGDTHGDLNASMTVVGKYLDSNTTLVFLGDYVDRGTHSIENADYLFEQRMKNPDNVVLLQGNHEAYCVFPFSGPVDFWDDLSDDEFDSYTSAFKQLPIIFSVGDILAVHGAVPDAMSLKDVDDIEDLDKNWRAIVWGDFHSGGMSPRVDSIRPSFDREYFEKAMGKLDKNVLIRSHQSSVPTVMFNKRLATIFTSKYYNNGLRNVAIADFDKKRKIESIDDLMIERI